MICPTCKKEAGDQVCMCGKCPSCDPAHFAPFGPPYDVLEDPNSIEFEIRDIAEKVTKGGL